MKSLLSNETAVSCRVGGEMKHMRNFGIKRVDKGQTNTAKRLQSSSVCPSSERRAKGQRSQRTLCNFLWSKLNPYQLVLLATKNKGIIDKNLLVGPKIRKCTFVAHECC